MVRADASFILSIHTAIAWGISSMCHIPAVFTLALAVLLTACAAPQTYCPPPPQIPAFQLQPGIHYSVR
jgi:hypothetical protein